MQKIAMWIALFVVASLVHWWLFKASTPSSAGSSLRQYDIVAPKFDAANLNSEGGNILNIHVVPHTHDDIGWLKTVEQYYYGFNTTIQRAHVQAILDSTIESLVNHPNRTFTYVEQKFFSMWWKEQTDEMKTAVKKLVAEERFSFVNGGWCMHDEATTHFMGMIDQTTLGHDFLKKELGVIPTVGWQLDPFGHSSGQASYMTSLMGFDALYFGRIDHQDMKLRHETQECEGLWDASPNVGHPVFWGLTGSYGGNYGPYGGFSFDAHSDDEPLVGLSEERLLARMETFLADVKLQSDRTKGNNIMLTMGEDFNYENAEVYMKNNDLMIHAMLKFQASGQLDIASVLGPRFDSVNMFYSTPDYYTAQKYQETILAPVTWSTKEDDFFPYADYDDSYWTGYFVSRAGFKRLERVASSFLLAARQVEGYRRSDTDAVDEDCKCMEPLFELEDALGVAQHHDAVSGTAKQHVANDYAKRVQSGVNKASLYMAKKMKKLLLEEGTADEHLEDFGFCQLLNETTCEISEAASKSGDDLYVVVYSALASARSTIVGLPVRAAGNYKVFRVNEEADVVVASSSADQTNGKEIVYFETGPLPPTGAAVFKLSLSQEATLQNTAAKMKRTLEPAQASISNDMLKVDIAADRSMRLTNIKDGCQVELSQRWGYYTSFDSKQDEPGSQNSGAYIFRPSKPNQELNVIGAVHTEKRTSDLVEEVLITYEVPWLKEVMRVYKGEPYMEIEYTVGPIPVDDLRGKEIVTQYRTDVASSGVFYTDANGREFQKRTRSSRPTWNLTEHQPIAGNYYPINAAAYIEDDKKSLGVVIDRSQGGASLEDGVLEIMVQRRTLVDDNRGVGEPLNETDGDVTPYPPYGDASRYGEGIIIRGKHRVVVGGGNAGASGTRKEMDKAFSEPLIFVGSAKVGTEVPFRKKSFSLIETELPKNVMLVTFKHLPHEAARSFLIRLGHQYAAGEHADLSQPVSVDLEALVRGMIVSCQEKTLSGNRNIEEWQQSRLDWSGHMTDKQQIRCLKGDCSIELKSMQIRTFQIQIEIE